MHFKTIFKKLLATAIIATLLVMPTYAAEKEKVNFGSDKPYYLLASNIVETRDVMFEGNKVTALVLQRPEKNQGGIMYDFFEIVITDPRATMITSTIYVSDVDESMGDAMLEVIDGSVVYSPTLYFDFNELPKDSIFYFGFDIRAYGFESIHTVPVYLVFEDVAGSTTTTPVTEEPAVTEPVSEAKEITATPTASKVLVDGKDIAFEAYNIGGANYFKLRDLAMALTGSEKQFEVTWDAEKKAIGLVTDFAYTPVGNELTASTSTAPVKGLSNQSVIYLNDEVISLEAYTIGGNNYFKLRDVASVFDFGVEWNAELNQISLDTSVEYTPE